MLRKNSNRLISTLILAMAVSLTAMAEIAVNGARMVKVTPPATTGLDCVIVVETADGTMLSYTAASASAASSARWYSFNAMGGAYAQPIEKVTVNGNTTSVTALNEDSGYLIEADGRQTAFWVVNYADHYPTLTSFGVSPESDCDRVVFQPVGGFDRIVYYSVNGAPTTLSRDIKLHYNNLEIKGDSDDVTEKDYSWQQVEATATFSEISGAFSVQAPLCNTVFTLIGDRFLEAWSNPVEVSTDNYLTGRVEAKTWAVQGQRDNDNEQSSSASDSGLGGSAPCDITFYAVPTDAVMWGEWQFSATEDFADVMNRFNDYTLTYTFTEAGTTYVRFVCADATGNCEYESETYVISVGESKLLCPNAFSPHNQDGINDEWKVSYASLISFDCHIFNRWGKELFQTTNPAVGWDGRVGGKFVPSGVYFYVIKAEGADGVKYNLSGDINIVGSKLKPTTSTEE